MAASLLMSDLRELKSLLNLPDGFVAQDRNLLFMISMASAWIEDYLGRELGSKARTEYYDGTGSFNITLRSRPVFTTPTIRCWVSTDGFWGQPTDSFPAADELVYGDDFVLRIDQPNGVSSRSGILARRKSFWRPSRIREQGYLYPYVDHGHGNVKVIYTAGYTTDTLPEELRFAAATLATKMWHYFPEAAEITSENYEERSITLQLPYQKSYLLGGVKPLLNAFRNWKW